MLDEPVLPHRLKVLGIAIQPLLWKVEREINAPVRVVTPVSDILNVIPRSLDPLQTAVSRLEARIQSLMTEVVSREAASDSDVYRAVGGLETHFDDLLAGYHGVRALDARSEDARAVELMAAIYRHTLVEMRDWLRTLVDVLADPIGALRRRGLPADGHIEIPIVLKLTTAPQLADLLRWAQERSPGGQIKGQSELGFWGTTAAVALGWGIGQALFGDD